MKLRAIGTGGPFVRHPLVTSSFLLQSEGGNIVIGCGPNIPTKLDSINLSVEQIDMWMPLTSRLDQIGGLVEVASVSKKKPFLVAPSPLITELEELFFDLTKTHLSDSFEVRRVLKTTVNEEHNTDTVVFVRNYPTGAAFPSYSVHLEEAEVFISGDTELNEEFLHRYGVPSRVVLHSCSVGKVLGARNATLQEMQTLPLYIQTKIWLYGYDNTHATLEDPIPMLFLPQGTCVYDSERKEKHLDKERFIRESSRRLIGNQSN